jgi:hypothetical protein
MNKYSTEFYIEMANNQTKEDIVELLTKYPEVLPEKISQMDINEIADIYRQTTSAIWWAKVKRGPIKKEETPEEFQRKLDAIRKSSEEQIKEMKEHTLKGYGKTMKKYEIG